MKHTLVTVTALVLAPLLGFGPHAAEAAVVLPVWPAGKMSGVGAAAPEMEIPTSKCQLKQGQ